MIANGAVIHALAGLLTASYAEDLPEREADMMRAAAVRARDEHDAMRDRIHVLETALRSCLDTCERCGTFATWNSRPSTHYGYRPAFCDSCKLTAEKEVYADGRMVGQLMFGEWQRLTRNIELTRTYAPSASHSESHDGR